MPMQKLTVRRTCLIAILMLVGFSALWWGLWTIAATRCRVAIDNWIEVGRKSGYDIAYDGRKMFGFPHHVVLRFNNLH